MKFTVLELTYISLTVKRDISPISIVTITFNTSSKCVYGEKKTNNRIEIGMKLFSFFLQFLSSITMRYLTIDDKEANGILMNGI